MLVTVVKITRVSFCGVFVRFTFPEPSIIIEISF